MMATTKPFPFTAAEMRAQLPMKAEITDFDYAGPENRPNKTILTMEIRKPVGFPDECILVPVDEWKEMIAWVARYEKRAANAPKEDA